MKIRRLLLEIWGLVFLAIAVARNAEGQFAFTTNNGLITITGYNTAAGLNVAIPASTNGYPVIGIDSYAFEGSSLTSVTIPNSVTSIGNLAFFNCSSLTNITVTSGNQNYSSLNGVLFDQIQTTLLQFPAGLGGNYLMPNGVASIGNYAFAFCSSLTNVIIPNSVSNIGFSAFEFCSGLTSLIIPNSVASLGGEVFFDCSSLTGVTIPNSVTNIGILAFVWCASLTNITVTAGDPNYSSLNGVLFDQTQTTLIEYPDGLVGGYAIPNNVTTIGDFAFSTCANLANVTIPDSVTNIGISAFEDCSSLTSVILPNGVTSIGSEVFWVCSSLTNVVVPKSVNSIGSEAFEFCHALNSIYFEGNTPSPTNDTSVFNGDSLAVAYYLSGATGWGPMFDGIPTALWNTSIQTTNASVSMITGQFGFNITGTADFPIMVEATTNLANPTWIPLQTCALTNGLIYFSDPQWSNYPVRFYRISSQ